MEHTILRKTWNRAAQLGCFLVLPVFSGGDRLLADVNVVLTLSTLTRTSPACKLAIRAEQVVQVHLSTSAAASHATNAPASVRNEGESRNLSRKIAIPSGSSSECVPRCLDRTGDLELQHFHPKMMRLVARRYLRTEGSSDSWPLKPELTGVSMRAGAES